MKDKKKRKDNVLLDVGPDSKRDGSDDVKELEYSVTFVALPARALQYMNRKDEVRLHCHVSELTRMTC